MFSQETCDFLVSKLLIALDVKPTAARAAIICVGSPNLINIMKTISYHPSKCLVGSKKGSKLYDQATHGHHIL